MAGCPNDGARVQQLTSKAGDVLKHIRHGVDRFASKVRLRRELLREEVATQAIREHADAGCERRGQATEGD